MMRIIPKMVEAEDTALRHVIASWYHQEWHIPPEKTIQLLEKIAGSASECHLILEVDGEPVATAGLHEKVGITEVDPELGAIKGWLAMVFTVPQHRNRGYASRLCTHIEEIAKQKGLERLHLFTHTAEPLYASLHWTVIKRIKIEEKRISIMEKTLPK